MCLYLSCNSICLISGTFNTNYFYPDSSTSHIAYPSGTSVPSIGTLALCFKPNLSKLNSILISLGNIPLPLLTFLTPLRNNFKWSILNTWFIICWSFPDLWPIFSYLNIIETGIVVSTNNRRDASESPWKILYSISASPKILQFNISTILKLSMLLCKSTCPLFAIFKHFTHPRMWVHVICLVIINPSH